MTIQVDEPIMAFRNFPTRAAPSGQYERIADV
jgi:hypothetical protein